MDARVHIALVANDRYRPGLLCTRHSMVKACRDPERLVFHEFGDADMEPFLSRIPLEDYNGSKLPYLRLFLPELLPDCDWVIYSDVDTLWFRDPCELWEERDESVSVCWVKDFPTGGMDFERWTEKIGLEVRPSGAYACSGVTLINLKRWREKGFTQRAIDFLRRYGCPPYADQDVMNVLFADDAKMLPADWDVMIPPYFWRPCVLHVTGMGLRLLGSDHYDGNIAQYVFWFNYYRRHILNLPRMKLRFPLRLRFLLLAAANLLLGPFFALLDSFPGPYPWKLFLMRIRRRLAYARFGLVNVARQICTLVFLMLALVGCSLFRSNPLDRGRGAVVLVFDTRTAGNLKELRQTLLDFDARATVFASGPFGWGVALAFKDFKSDGHEVGLSGLKGVDPQSYGKMYGQQKYFQDEILTQFLDAERQGFNLRYYLLRYPSKMKAEALAIPPFLVSKGFACVVDLMPDYVSPRAVSVSSLDSPSVLHAYQLTEKSFDRAQIASLASRNEILAVSPSRQVLPALLAEVQAQGVPFATVGEIVEGIKYK